MNGVLNRVVAFYSPNIRNRKDDHAETPTVMRVVDAEDRLTKETLQKSQAYWLAYRNSACEAVGHSFEGGTASAQAIPACMLRLTEERTRWLQSNFITALEKEKATRNR